MFAIEVEFLMGRAIATQSDRRDRAEWPPHPQRLFSALIATHFELDLGPKTETALKWLEKLPPPEIRVDIEPSYRSTLSHWVPVNDEAIKIEKNRSDFRNILERRNRQERFFPAVVPEDPVVVFQWPSAPGIDQHRDVLSRLVEGLSYLGHSASPIRACLRDQRAEPTLVPATEGDYSLRVPGPGRFNRLKDVHQLRLEEESAQPPLGRTQAYGKPGIAPESVFSADAFVLAFEDGPKLSLDVTLPLIQHLRNAVLARLGTSTPGIFTGHDADGNPSSDVHLAFVPLAFVGSRHADGSLKGAALVLPRNADQPTRRRLRAALSAPWNLHLGPLGSIAIRLVEQTAPELASLRFERYSRASRQWVSVTPIVLDKHPKKGRLSAEKVISDCCQRIGLPCPVEVRLGPVSALSGVPHVREFRGQSKQTDYRVRQHVLLSFDRSVRGPMLLGAGRFMGLGLLLPSKAEGAS